MSSNQAFIRKWIVITLQLNTYQDPDETTGNNSHAVIIGMEINDDVKPGLLARKSRRVKF